MKISTIFSFAFFLLALTGASFVAAEGERWSTDDEDSGMEEGSEYEMDEASDGSAAAGGAVNGTNDGGVGHGGGGPPLVPPGAAGLGGIGAVNLGAGAGQSSRSTSRTRLISVGLPSCVARPVLPSRVSARRQRDNFLKAVQESFDEDGNLEWTNAALNGMLRLGKRGQWRKAVKDALKKEIDSREEVARRYRENHVAEARDKFVARVRKGFRLSRDQAIEVWNDGGMGDRIRARFEKELEEDLDDLKDLSLKAMEHCGKEMDEYFREKDNDDDGDDNGSGNNSGPGDGSAMGGGGILA